MPDPPTIPELPNDQIPPIGSHFMVVFFIAGVVPNPLDIRFQTVSGISSTIETEQVTEGGENLFTHRLPKRVTYQNLVLKRGMVSGSPLNIEFGLAMDLMKLSPSNVLVMLLNEKSNPHASWLFKNAYPVTWTVSDLDATKNAVVIDTMELAYTRFQNLRL
ncbi:MAG: phage tail protein [Coleofasciculus chthonoplastes F3-SA18-01]|uniref:phage tail protein n=1 Tax=Coleofasciculus TaxID=669368 RepID=UPI0033036E22